MIHITRTVFIILLSYQNCIEAFAPSKIESGPTQKLIQETVERNLEHLNCPHFKSCPGCIAETNLATASPAIPILDSAQLYFQSSAVQQKAIHPRNDFYQIVLPSEISQWRTQAKLAVQPKSTWGAGCVFGLYEKNSHNVVEIPNCVVHHPSINRAMDILSKATTNVQTPAWKEDSGSNGLRYVQLSVERMSGRVSMTLVWHAGSLKETQPHLARLIKECKKMDPSLFHSIWCHTNDSLGNAIFAKGEKNWHPMDGPEFVREPIPGTDLEKKEGLLFFSPSCFRQANMDGFDEIAMHVARCIPGGSKVCELYAGVGLIGLTALSYWHKQSEPLQWLRCSDENPANPRSFNKNVNSMPSEVTGRMDRGADGKSKKFVKGDKGKQNKNSNKERTLEEIMSGIIDGSRRESSDTLASRKGKVSYMVGTAANALFEGQALGADVLIVDPPRKGLEEPVLEQLSKPHNPKQDYTEDPVLLSGPKYSINWTNNVHTLIYVSCGFDALARDCDRLLKGNAGWKLESATGYVLFPGSNHVETVAIFKRRAGRDGMMA